MDYEQQLKAMAGALVHATTNDATLAEIEEVAADLLKLIPRCLRFHRGGRYGTMTTKWKDGRIVKEWGRDHNEMDDVASNQPQPSHRSGRDDAA